MGRGGASQSELKVIPVTFTSSPPPFPGGAGGRGHEGATGTQGTQQGQGEGKAGITWLRHGAAADCLRFFPLLGPQPSPQGPAPALAVQAASRLMRPVKSKPQGQPTSCRGLRGQGLGKGAGKIWLAEKPRN